MARRIIIHAGQHKTGSTSIQHYIEAHEAALRSRGFQPFVDWTASLEGPRHDGARFNAKFVANAVVRDSLATPMRIAGVCSVLSPHERERGLDRINAAFKSEPAETLLISAEAFSFLRDTGEHQWIERLCHGLEWRALMFLREPSSWLQSWKVQITHSGLIGKPGAAPGQGVADLAPSSWLVDHDAIRGFWNGRCTFLNYEAAMTQHDSVIPAFLMAIGLDPAACPAWDGVFLNTSWKKQAELTNRA
jgi:hypothetical protein